MSREIMQQALDALEYHTMQTRPISHTDKAIEALEAALAQPEPVVPFPSFMRKRIEEAMDLAINPQGMSVHDGKANVLASDLHRMLLVIDSVPPRKPWQGLTSEDWENTPTSDKQGCERDAELFDWIEQTLKDKNDTF